MRVFFFFFGNLAYEIDISLSTIALDDHDVIKIKEGASLYFPGD